jgi:hypothetical protein
MYLHDGMHKQWMLNNIISVRMRNDDASDMLYTAGRRANGYENHPHLKKWRMDGS